MKKYQTLILVSLLVLIVTAVVVMFVASQNKGNSDTVNSSTKKTEIVVVSSSGDKGLNQSSSTISNVASSDGVLQSSDSKKVIVESGYINYDSAKLENAKYGKVILFFHATWCPSCKSLDSDIKNNLSKIPKDTLILKVDYDSNSDLKSKYKVTSQHTLVQVDFNGNLIKANPGLYQLTTLDSVIKSF